MEEVKVGRKKKKTTREQSLKGKYIKLYYDDWKCVYLCAYATLELGRSST